MLYREPKLLKVWEIDDLLLVRDVVSVLYREPKLLKDRIKWCTRKNTGKFQCSTVSRNC